MVLPILEALRVSFVIREYCALDYWRELQNHADAATVAAIAGLYLDNADHAAFGADGAPDEATWANAPGIASAIRQLEEWIQNA